MYREKCVSLHPISISNGCKITYYYKINKENWKEYSFRYKYGSSIYNFKILNQFKENKVKTITINGDLQKENKVILIDNNKIYDVQIII